MSVDELELVVNDVHPSPRCCKRPMSRVTNMGPTSLRYTCDRCGEHLYVDISFSKTPPTPVSPHEQDDVE